MTKRKYSILTIKATSYLSLIFFILFSTFSALPLEAAKWGKTKEIVEHKKNRWNQVFMKLKKANFTALIPNFSGSGDKKGVIHISGHIGEKHGYLIETGSESEYKPPESEKAFIKAMKRAYPGYHIKSIQNNTQGAIYVADLTPSDKSQNIYWRYFVTKHNLIKMGTDDSNKDNRLFFFQSASIKPIQSKGNGRSS